MLKGEFVKTLNLPDVHTVWVVTTRVRNNALVNILAANILRRTEQDELTAYRDSFNPARIARDISELQRLLLKMAKEKTDQLHPAGILISLPDVRKGIRVKAS